MSGGATGSTAGNTASMAGAVVGGRYKLVRVLGSGAMGAVWLAEHTTLGTAFAVKLLHADLARNPHATARFGREAQLAARIKSPFVAQVFDHGVTDLGDPYIAMEYLVGENLRERLVARRRLSLDETARIVLDVCRGLLRAHEAGLVHRDIKPENVFLAHDGPVEIAKLVDFGVAKTTDALAISGFDPTRTGALLGTPFYMSPEQAQGLKNIDGRSDLWSVAVVAFECMTGEQPFHAPALGPLIGKIIAGEAPVPSQVAPDAAIPAAVDAWMARALARAPEQRYASAAELAEALLLAVHGEAAAATMLDGAFRSSFPDRLSLGRMGTSSPAIRLSDAALSAVESANTMVDGPPQTDPAFAKTMAQPATGEGTPETGAKHAWLRTAAVVLLIVAAFVGGMLVRR